MDYGRLISIEGIEDSANHEDIESALRDGNENLEDRLHALKQESSARFVRRWDEIISKYSQIDDNTQSDEIDLRTGKIVTDNGHLRSLATEGSLNGVHFQPSIWSGDYDFDKVIREEEREYRSRKKAKSHLKRKLKLQQLFHTVPPDTAVEFVASDPLQDNLLILSPSPTKKQRLMNSSPIKGSRGISNDTPPLEPSSRSIHRQESTYRQEFLSSSPIKHIPMLPRITAEGYTDDETLDLNNSDCEILFLMMSDIVKTPHMAIFHCAFDCSFTTESKNEYKAHLLSDHADSLRRIGYPVKQLGLNRGIREHITELAILRLTLHFPLKVAMPLKPIVCGLSTSSGLCSRVFLDTSSAEIHRSSHPSKCSTRRQVLVCPILGCEYMTDESYKEWRNHVLLHQESQNDTHLESLDQEPGNVSDLFSDSISSLSISDDEDSAKSTYQQTATGLMSLFGRKVDEASETPQPQRPHLPTFRDHASKASSPEETNKLEKFEICSDASEDEGVFSTGDGGYDSLDEFFQRDSS